jgi:hypothetical protein
LHWFLLRDSRTRIRQFRRHNGLNGLNMSGSKIRHDRRLRVCGRARCICCTKVGSVFIIFSITRAVLNGVAVGVAICEHLTRSRIGNRGISRTCRTSCRMGRLRMTRNPSQHRSLAFWLRYFRSVVYTRRSCALRSRSVLGKVYATVGGGGKAACDAKRRRVSIFIFITIIINKSYLN